MDSKCKCNHCGQNLGFDTRDVGATTACPHCSMDTILFIPPLPPAPKFEPKLQPAEKVAEKPIEDSLENVGNGFFISGVLFAMIFGCAAFLAFVSSLNNSESIPIGISCVIATIIAFAQGLILSILFRSLAEIIRLLRKIASV